MRVLFIVLGCLALMVAGLNASRQPPDVRALHFLGGALWALLFFGLAWYFGRPRPKQPALPPDDGNDLHTE